MTGGQNRNSAIVRGGVLVALSSIAARGASFFAQLVLGRLLLPEDFGVYAIALTFTTLAASANSVLRSFLVDALKKDWDFGGLYRLVMWTSVGVSVAAVAMSGALARPFDEPGLATILACLFAAMPLQIAPAFGAARLTKALRFRELSTMWTWSAVLCQIVTVAGALAGLGAISFVGGVVVGSLAEVVLVRRHSGPYPELRGRPRLEGVADTRQLRWIPVSIVVLAVWINGDYASAGLFETAAVVGVYFFAYQLTTALTQPFTLALSSVLLPSFSSLSGEREGADAFSLTVLLVPLASGLPFGLLAVTAAPLTHLVWAGAWDVAIVAIVVLGLVTPMKLLLSTSLSILQASGDWQGYTRLLAVSAVATVVAASVGGMIGGVGGLVSVIAVSNVVLGLGATVLVGATFGLTVAESVFRPFCSWMIWLSGASMVALVGDLHDERLSSIPWHVGLFLLSTLPFVYALFGDAVVSVWRIGARRNTPTAGGAATPSELLQRALADRPPGGWSHAEVLGPPPMHRSAIGQSRS